MILVNADKLLEERRTIMDYDKIIDLDGLTLEDCMNLFNNEGITVIVNDGRIVNLVKE